MSGENERLRQELEYLSNLISQHKSSQQGVQTDNTKRDIHAVSKTFKKSDKQQGAGGAIQKQFLQYYGNKTLDTKHSKTLIKPPSSKSNTRSVIAPQGKQLIKKETSVPKGKTVNDITVGSQLFTFSNEKITSGTKGNGSNIGGKPGTATAKQPKVPPSTKTNSKRVVLKPGSKVASSLQRPDSLSSKGMLSVGDNIETVSSKATLLSQGLTNARDLASVSAECGRKVLLPTDKNSTQKLSSALSSSQARVKYSSSVPSALTSATKCNIGNSNKSVDKTNTVFLANISDKSHNFPKQVIKTQKAATSAVQTTDKIEAAQELLNQIKAMNRQKPVNLHPQRHLSAPQLTGKNRQQKHQSYTTSSVPKIGSLNGAETYSKHPKQNKYKMVKGSSPLPNKVYPLRQVSPLKFSHDRNLFDNSGAPSPIVNLSASWSGDDSLPMVSTPNWLHGRLDKNVRFPNFPSNKAAKGCNIEGYSSPSKYSLVRNNSEINCSDSSSVTSKTSNFEHLSSLTKSNMMVVKLRSKYKLVKKAIQTKQKSSFKQRRPRPSLSPGKQPRYRTSMNSYSFRRSSSNKWTNRYSYVKSSRNSTGFSVNRSLNRNALNQSRSKFKFRKNSANRFTKAVLGSYGDSYGQRRFRSVPSKLKLDHRSERSSRRYSTANKMFVMIGGALYQSSRQKLTKTSKSLKIGRSYQKKFMNSSRLKTITIRGDDKFTVGRKGKSLRRLSWEKSADNAAFMMSVSKPPTSARLVASRALQRSIHTASVMRYKNKSAKSMKKEYCKFYNRFGRCNRGEKCKFIHDPEKVAVCTRFLRGTCKVTDCPFSHKVTPEKMPVCSYFLKGICSRDNCPYTHVNVSKDAVICQDFVNGFCALGNKCTKKHSLICPEFASTGSCRKGSACKLKHPPSRKRKGSRRAGITGEAGGGEPRLKRLRNKTAKGEEEKKEDINLPMSKRNLPSFIAIGVETDESTQASSKSVLDSTIDSAPKKTDIMFIKPRFSFNSPDNSLM